MRVGVLGGTFDPIHNGHLVVASDVRAVLDLDEVLLVVAGEPWQKVGSRQITPATYRLGMVEAAIDGVEGVVASDVEIRREGPSYMADTLAELSGMRPTAELVLIVGSDVAAELASWVRVEEVRRLASLALVDRPGGPAGLEVAAALRGEGWRAQFVPIPTIEVSSSEVRGRVAAGLPLHGLVPPAVVRRIAAARLYAQPR